MEGDRDAEVSAISFRSLHLQHNQSMSRLPSSIIVPHAKSFFSSSDQISPALKLACIRPGPPSLRTTSSQSRTIPIPPLQSPNALLQNLSSPAFPPRGWCSVLRQINHIAQWIALLLYGLLA